MRHALIPLAVLSTFALAACGSMPADDAAPSTSAPSGTVKVATATLAAKSGSQAAGTLNAQSMGNGVHVKGRVTGLPPNRALGFHIHENGDCSAADASSAGGHFNPTTQPHGNASSGPHHLGDQMNLSSDASGMAVVDAHFSGVTLGTGQANDVNGKAIVIHADPDDYASQPAGNAGARIACGVIGN